MINMILPDGKEQRGRKEKTKKGWTGLTGWTLCCLPARNSGTEKKRQKKV